jgi:hypothetical protein
MRIDRHEDLVPLRGEDEVALRNHIQKSRSNEVANQGHSL